MIGQRFTVEISDIAFGGKGVARLDERVVFIPFVLPGERVEIELTELKKRFARGKLLRVIEPSPDRVAPPCPYFGECGGCQYQHMAYSAQLRVKQKQIADIFQRVGGFSPSVVKPMVACPAPYGYRNRIMVRSQWDRFKRGLNIGFLRRDNRLVVDVEQCQIAEPGVNEQLAKLRKHPPPRGGLKAVLRVPPRDWEVPGDSFFQNNFHLLPELVAIARDRLRSGGSRHLLDLYCGVGFFSLSLADLVESYLGVELDRKAVEAARRNAAQRGRANGRFVLGQAEAVLPRLIEGLPPDQTTILLDPPRRGCPRETVAFLEDFGPRQIMYVSCHPATLARDARWFCEKGRYQLEGVAPLDMFPQTQHAECVADLRRRA